MPFQFLNKIVYQAQSKSFDHCHLFKNHFTYVENNYTVVDFYPECNICTHGSHNVLI